MTSDAAETVEETIRIRPKSIEREMKESYMDYSMSVIVGRALPDARDGLKPVHRRILHAMNEMGLTFNKSYKKSARVVGEVLGKYHPHGDSAVYETMVRMAQDFSLRYPLVDGQGNFGSVDGDSAAAMRYTEARLSRVAAEVLRDIDKDTVDFRDNFDASLKEPTVLPTILPNLLVNGSSGIAVGMATNMAPHNLGEVIDATVALIDDPELDSMDLMQYVRGPDFPTGGTVYGIGGVVSAYTTGRGAVRVRAKTHYEEDKKTKKGRIIVTEIPYMVNKSSLLETIAHLVKDKKIEGITDLRDESDRRGMRVVIELKRGAMEDVVLNQLYKHTQLQSTFGINNLAIVDGKPKVLTLRSLIDEYVKHRQVVVRRRTEFELRKAEDRSHILEGLLTALDNLDEIISIIRKAKDAREALEAIMAKFLLSERQTKAILEMRLQKLTGMERQNIKDEHVLVNEKITEYKTLLEDEANVLAVIKEECIEIKEKYGDARRSFIEENAEDLDIEDLIPVEDVVITITDTGYIKRMPLDTYKTQRRGGVGLIGMETKEEDHVIEAFVTCSHDYILFFTNLGRLYWLKAYKVPQGGRHSKGKAIINLLPRLQPGEEIEEAIHVKEFDDEHYLVFCTKNGKIKKTPLSAYGHVRVTGVRAINLNEGDELVQVKMTDGDKQIVLATMNGMAVRFHESETRPMGRVAAGVRGMKLREGDRVVSMAVVDEDDILLTITENGYGKRTLVEQYRKIHRGGFGVITIKTEGRNGKVINVMRVDEDDSLLISSKEGMLIRLAVEEIRVISRNTMGVRIMRLKKEGDTVMAVARMAAHEDIEEDPEAGDVPAQAVPGSETPAEAADGEAPEEKVSDTPDDADEE